MQLQMLAPILGVVGFVIAILIYNSIKSQPVGNEKMKEIAEAIHGGAMAFLNREYRVLAIFIVAVFILIFISMGIQLRWLFWAALSVPCSVAISVCRRQPMPMCAPLRLHVPPVRALR